jgi:hypothetical protein
MLCVNKVYTEVCSARLYVCSPLLLCAVTELVIERARLPYCITDRHLQHAHKKRQGVGLSC